MYLLMHGGFLCAAYRMIFIDEKEIFSLTNSALFGMMNVGMVLNIIPTLLCRKRRGTLASLGASFLEKMVRGAFL